MNLWTLNKLIVLVLIAAFVFLLFEIRMEHQDVLGEYKIAWTPILYSGLMIIAGFAALFLSRRVRSAFRATRFARRIFSTRIYESSNTFRSRKASDSISRSSFSIFSINRMPPR